MFVHTLIPGVLCFVYHLSSWNCNYKFQSTWKPRPFSSATFPNLWTITSSLLWSFSHLIPSMSFCVWARYFGIETAISGLSLWTNGLFSCIFDLTPSLQTRKLLFLIPINPPIPGGLPFWILSCEFHSTRCKQALLLQHHTGPERSSSDICTLSDLNELCCGWNLLFSS